MIEGVLSTRMEVDGEDKPVELYGYASENYEDVSEKVLAAMLRDAGFEQVTLRNLSAGIAAIHSGWRL